MTKRILNTYTEYVEPLDTFTEDEQMDQCCETVLADLCADVGKTEAYESADSSELDLDALLNEARAANPGLTINGVQLIDVGPTGDCGEKHTEWTGRLNCCDGVEPLEWDSDNSIDVIVDDSKGIVSFTGGKLPLTVSVRGSGFFINAKGDRDAVLSGRSFFIYTGDACGTGSYTVTDGCTTAKGTVKSTDGVWEGDCTVYSVADYGPGNAYTDVDMFEMSEACTPVRSASGRDYDCAPYCMRYANWKTWAWSVDGWSFTFGDSAGLKYVVGWDCNQDSVGTGGVEALAAAIASAPLAYGEEPNEVFPNGPADVGCSCGSVEWVC